MTDEVETLILIRDVLVAIETQARLLREHIDVLVTALELCDGD